MKKIFSAVLVSFSLISPFSVFALEEITVDSDDSFVIQGDCEGLSGYMPGSPYVKGESVTNILSSNQKKIEYRCNVPGWCSSAAAWAYEPGNGLHWEMAWNEIGVCSDGDNGNEKPVAESNGPYRAILGESIVFSSQGSNDPDGNIISYRWNFGDGTTSDEENPVHTYAQTGLYTVSLTVVDDNRASAVDSTTAQVLSDGDADGQLPSRVLVGYWHNFINGAGYLPLRDVNASWDIINIAFAENKRNGEEGEVSFAPAEESEESFLAGVKAHQANGKKVLISLGGANAHIQLNSPESRENLKRTLGEIIARYGFDGLDIDLEGASINMTAGDTVSTPKTPTIVNLIEVVKSLKARFGSGFILTMAPETAYVQGGYAVFGGIWGAYLPLIHALRDDLTLLHVQHYNTGSIIGRDDKSYGASTTDFHVALTDMMITGFPAGRNASNFFPGLREDQLAIGLPATANAAGSGLTSVESVHAALDCLYKTQNCGTYRPARAYPAFRGLMTWSINWDVHGGLSFSEPHRRYLDNY